MARHQIGYQLNQKHLNYLPLFFLIYINDLPHNLVSSVKLFADGTSLFSTARDTDASRTALNNIWKKYQNGNVSENAI